MKNPLALLFFSLVACRSDGPVRPPISVPAGTFIAGCNLVRGLCPGGSAEAQLKTLPSFRIDATEVTVAQYERCVVAGSCSDSGLNQAYIPGAEVRNRTPCNWGRPNLAQHPVNCVSWSQAVAYCRFMRGRLPTEDEWEKTARGTDGRPYPWGSQPESASLGAFGGAHTSSVAAFPAGRSPYGVFDMSGNVAEWTNDLDLGDAMFVRGGAYRSVGPSLRTFDRDAWPADTRHPTIGFRCVY